MEPTSHHIMPLIIHSFGADTHTRKHIQTFADRSNFKKPGLKMTDQFPSLISTTAGTPTYTSKATTNACTTVILVGGIHGESIL